MCVFVLSLWFMVLTGLGGGGVWEERRGAFTVSSAFQQRQRRITTTSCRMSTERCVVVMPSTNASLTCSTWSVRRLHSVCNHTTVEVFAPCAWRHFCLRAEMEVPRSTRSVMTR